MSQRLRIVVFLVWVFCLWTNNAYAQDSISKRVLLLGQSPDGHKRSTHEYMAGVHVIAKCLSDVPHLETTIVKADEPWTDGPDLLRDADGVVMFLSEGAKWIHGDPRRLEALAQLAARGGGLVTIHWAMGTKEARYIDGYLKLFGGCHGGPDRKYKVLDQALIRIADLDHPITTNIADFKVREEFYYRLKFVNSPDSIRPILNVEIDGGQETVAWAWQRADGGRSFGFSGGHFHENWARQECRRLIAQAILWSLQMPIPLDGLPVEVSADDLQLEGPFEQP